MKLLLLCFTTLLLFSCSETDTKGRIESLKVMESCIFHKYLEGSEQRESMRGMAMEKHDPEPLINRVNLLYAQMQNIDSLSVWLISKLNHIRGRIIGKRNTDVNELNKPIQLSYPSNGELNDEHLPTNQETNEIVSAIELYRNKLCQAVIHSRSLIWNNKTYEFNAPESLSFTNSEEKREAIISALKSSRFHEEEKYTVVPILEILTEHEGTWNAMLSLDNDWIDLSLSLLAIQQKILEARWYAMKHLNFLIGCRNDFNFTRVNPIINGTTFAKPRDTVQFEVFIAGYNEFFEQRLINTEGATFLKLEDGKAYFEAIMPESGELSMNGDISILKKSGSYSNPMRWSHTIQVIEPK